MIQLREYQRDVDAGIVGAWAAGHQNVCAVLPTGAGKTVIFGHRLAQERGVSFVIAHRQELIHQISMALAKYGVKHRIEAPEPLIRYIVKSQMQAHGRHYYDPQAQCILTGVITLLNRAGSLSNAISRAKLWVSDEAHHLLGGNRPNVWGKAVALFPGSCRGLGVTATPERADGKGIGRQGSGVMDVLVEGPDMRTLVYQGYLSDYRIFAPTTYIDMANVPVGSTGDYSKPKLAEAVQKSKIVGDLAASYVQFAPGKIGVTFVPNVKVAQDVSANFNAVGVPSEVVHAKTKDKDRQGRIAALARGDLKQLVNVDIFGEGFDLPAIEACSFARPTESYPLFAQQFGRALRPMEGKQHAIIIDHVGNILRHGLPDKPRSWSLMDRESKGGTPQGGVIPVRVCLKCTAAYESFRKLCPFCGYEHRAEAVTDIEMAEGDLSEMDPAVLARMRGEVERIDKPAEAVGDAMRHANAPGAAVGGAMKQHRARQEAQAELRDIMATWGGYQVAAGVPARERHVRFYHYFGVDVLSAQALGRPAAEELTRKIKGRLRA